MEVQSWAIRWKWSGTELLHVATPSELFADGAFFCFSVVGACQETDVNPGWTTIYDGSLDPNVKQLRTRLGTRRTLLDRASPLMANLVNT